MARRGENIHKRKDGRWEGRYIKARTPDRRICWGYIYGTTWAMQGWTTTLLQTPGCAMCRMRSLKPIKIVCRSCGADVQNIITVSLLVPKRVQNCGAKVI